MCYYLKIFRKLSIIFEIMCTRKSNGVYFTCNSSIKSEVFNCNLKQSNKANRIQQSNVRIGVNEIKVLLIL